MKNLAILKKNNKLKLKINFSLLEIKKKFPLKDFVKDLRNILAGVDLLDAIMEASVIIPTLKKKGYDDNLIFKNISKYLNEFYNNKKLSAKLMKYAYTGELLPLINDNFKLEHRFQYADSSHYLISSKIDKTWIYFCSGKNIDNANFIETYAGKYFKKGMNKKEFFKFLFNRDKKQGYLNQIGYDDFYFSPEDKINYYYDFYLKN